MTNIAASHPAEPLCLGIGGLSNRHTDHGGPTKNVDLHDASDLHSTFRSPGAQKIWHGSEARLPQKVFSRTYDHFAQETEI
jgi:hypothetical protein